MYIIYAPFLAYVRYNITVWILAGNGINFSIAIIPYTRRQAISCVT